MKGEHAMTGRDLSVYILTNRLEDELVFKDNTFMGFISVDEAAKKLGVGVETIKLWIQQERLKYFKIGDLYFVASDCKLSIYN